jgi:hypothetical protein
MLNSCRDAEFTFPGLELHPICQIMADAGRHQAGKIAVRPGKESSAKKSHF